MVSGTTVSSTLGRFVAAPLTAGAWRLSSDTCGFDGGFIVGPAQPRPGESAILTFVDSLSIDQRSADSCGAAIAARQMARLRINPLPEMAPWLRLARWELEVDGVNTATSGFGSVPVQGSTLTGGAQGLLMMKEFVDAFTVTCEAAPPGGRAVTRMPGKHTAQVFAVIEGWPRIASNTLEVDVQCPPPRGCGCSESSLLMPAALALLLSWRARRESTRLSRTAPSRTGTRG